MNKTFYIIVAILGISGCANSSRYVQSVRFPEDATPEERWRWRPGLSLPGNRCSGSHSN